MAEDNGKHSEVQADDPGKRPPWWKRLWAWSEFGKKPGWDWLQLLIVPVMLSLITVVFSWQQNTRQQDIEDRRADSARMVEEQRAQDAALQAYLDQMSTLLLEKKLDSPDEDGTVRSVARARTLTILPTLDGHRKYSVVLFLAESRLIHKENHIVWLVGADLSKLDVRSRTNLGWNLSETVLHGTDLSGANLRGVWLRQTALSNTDLSGADLSDADLTGADLSDAVLSDTDLSGADLSRATVTEAQLATSKSLEGATLPDGSKHP